MNITLSNGHIIKRVVTGSILKVRILGMVFGLGFFNPEKFTVFTKTMNLAKVSTWRRRNLGKNFFDDYSVVVSITGHNRDFVSMVEKINAFKNLAGIEIVPLVSQNPSEQDIKEVVESIKKAKRISRFPIIVKLPVGCHGLESITRSLHGIAEAVSIDDPSSVCGNGVRYMAVRILSRQGCLPVISSTVNSTQSIDLFNTSGAGAIRVGSVNPFKLSSLIVYSK